jgi:predicted RNA-binding protein with PUA-like domain
MILASRCGGYGCRMNSVHQPNAINHWLFKTEPHIYSVNDLATSDNKIARWDGIRNYQARNFLRDDTAINDRVFLYHCQCSKPGIYGVARINRAGYADPAQFDSGSAYFDAKARPDLARWYCVDIQLEHALEEPLLLPRIKDDQRLSQLGLFKQPRLSVVPITESESTHLMALILPQHA